MLQGKDSEADSLYLRAIEVGEKTWGPNHVQLAAMLNNRAIFLTKQVRADRDYQKLCAGNLRYVCCTVVPAGVFTIIDGLGDIVGSPVRSQVGKYIVSSEPLPRTKPGACKKRMHVEPKP